jgi:upstream activation factor subunit UAF30
MTQLQPRHFKALQQALDQARNDPLQSRYLREVMSKLNAPSVQLTEESEPSRAKLESAWMRKLTVSEALGDIVGHHMQPRSEVVSNLWAYIKKNNLQDSRNKRMVNCDVKLKNVFGQWPACSLSTLSNLIIIPL